MGYTADKTAYNNAINNDISTQTTPNSIPPEVVGAGYTDLADLLEPYINSINNEALLSGAGVPSNSLGSDLDLYYRQTNPIEIYRKISGVWVLQVSLPIGFTLPEGNLTVRTSIAGFLVTATKGGWVINNTVYQKNTQTQLSVDPADLNFGRIDNIYANTSNNILYQVGTAQSSPVAPTLPANTILIDQVIVPASSSGDDPYLLFGGGSPSEAELNFGNSTGLIQGGILTINVDATKFNISAGTGLFVDYTSPIPPTEPSVINFGPNTAVTVTNLTTSPSSYIGINASGTIVQQISPFTPTQRRSIATLGILIHTNLTNINAINSQGSTILAPANQLHDLIEAIGPLNLTGNKYSAASTNLTIQKTAGTVFKFGCNSSDYTNPHQVNQSAGNPVTFRYRTRNGEVSGDTTNIIPGSYDNAGTITAVGINQFTIQHITMFQSGLTRVQYGQNLYSTLADAQAAAFSEAFAVEANIAANGIFRAYLILKGNATDLSNSAQALFLEVPKFGGSTGNAGSALTSANIIAALGYTPVDGPASSADNAIARYDGITGNIIQDSAVHIDDNGDIITTTTGGFKLHTGTTAQRPVSLVDGWFRKNNSLTGRALEYYDLTSASWRTLIDSANITSNAILNQNSVIQNAAFKINDTGELKGLISSGSFNASGGFAKGNLFTNSLTAIVNNDVLIGLDINPSFTVGLFTGLATHAIRAIIDTSATMRSIALFRNINSTTESSIGIQDDTGNRILSLGVKASTSALSSDFGTNGDAFVRASQSALGLSLISASPTGLIKFNINGTVLGLIFSNGNNIIQTGGTFTDNGEKLQLTGRQSYSAISAPSLTVGFGKIWGQTTNGITRIHVIDDTGNNGQVIQSGYGLKMPQRTVTGNTTIVLSDYNLACDATTGVITISLPTAASAIGHEFTVIKIDGSVNNVVIDPNGSETINGAATASNNTQFMSKTFYSNGTNWFIKQ
jgi:hypothetical protein